MSCEQLPRVECEESVEERCFKFIRLEPVTKTIEVCNTMLAEPKCNKVTVSLPAQKCVEELKSYKEEY